MTIRQKIIKGDPSLIGLGFYAKNRKYVYDYLSHLDNFFIVHIIPHTNNRLVYQLHNKKTKKNIYLSRSEMVRNWRRLEKQKNPYL